jgi:hypothetical protein
MVIHDRPHRFFDAKLARRIIAFSLEQSMVQSRYRVVDTEQDKLGVETALTYLHKISKVKSFHKACALLVTGSVT